jgi:hypothetical protein
MVINHLLDCYVGYLGPVDTTNVECRDRIVVWLENQSIRSPQVDGEVAASIRGQLVTVAGGSVHVGQGGRAKERHQSPFEEFPVIGSPMLASYTVV